MTQKHESPVTERRGVQSVSISVSILKVLTESDRALPLKAISDAVGMASSNVHRYLASFTQAGLLRQDPGTRLYDVGPLALQLGLTALNRLTTVELAAPEMERLASSHNVLSLLSVFSLHGPTIVRVQQSKPPIITSVNLGSLLPMRSATGQAFLAFLPAEMTEHVMAAEFPKGGPNSVAGRQLRKIRSGVEKIRKDFFATVGIDVLPGLHAVASPILNYYGEAQAVLSITRADEKLGSAKHPANRDLVETARRLSQVSGYSPGD